MAQLYKHRWKIELFFKWIKQHLKIKSFWGRSENAVKTQIWIAISVYVLVAIAKKKFNLKQSLYEILQVVSICIWPDLYRGPRDSPTLEFVFANVDERRRVHNIRLEVINHLGDDCNIKN